MVVGGLIKSGLEMPVTRLKLWSPRHDGTYVKIRTRKWDAHCWYREWDCHTRFTTCELSTCNSLWSLVAKCIGGLRPRPCGEIARNVTWWCLVVEMQREHFNSPLLDDFRCISSIFIDLSSHDGRFRMMNEMRQLPDQPECIYEGRDEALTELLSEAVTILQMVTRSFLSFTMV
jgi:hypothetical protein